jgi:hypothetical protein
MLLHLNLPELTYDLLTELMLLGILVLLASDVNRRWFHPEEVVLTKYQKWVLSLWRPRRDFQSFLEVQKSLAVFFLLINAIVNTLFILDLLAIYANINPLGIHFSR